MIKISNLSKSFAGNVVLDNLNLEINEGDVIALIGASGAGKSTFLRSINYLEEADSGQLEIDNFKVDFEHISKQEILELRRKTGMVFQQFNLFERRTALQNVMEGLIQVKKMSKADARKLAEENLRKVGLEDRMDYYPKFLSGGQKQRVGIARAMAMQPTLLLLDEPTSALDPELVGEVQDTILNAAKNKQTMVLVSHEMDFVYNVATKVLFLEKGKIIEEGSPEEVFHHPKNPRTSEFLSRHVKTIDIGSSND
ncbi:amino acid ABC transporter ATP-binding protein [Lactococcus garvieae]|jgi:polar amino acid transport system ATP-binding protein|uniref:amino acid ABC transporter ATP-binding protein n=1 Tax=Lactococcus garvieae TaxID=1363 RepID=UPI000266D023|nr:amino acid ABC transporter ATP-binding protein [Lactococcus garvieae]MDN5628546.1 amino acid ABC transporter ATP-binding protein [Lactococcus sp.]EIT66413.1 Amino acid ABC transporter ATP-binding component [Lactococcus garvieae IPLA 31405]MBS4463550.1 amino acid ABC transporter ATP-binding protein [Lactococcus garvieae]MCO7129021.1 amino acid ABC transporter ATP-binding protein [Lactococcus garvieae]MDB7635208.1 amino acid ABC transporter ATP-binding protein [Lactococcus garvieae]